MKANFEYRGAKVSYSLKGEGRTLLLIHGFLGNKEIWKEYQSRLSKKFKVVCIDLPGHGESSSIGYVHSMELYAEVIKELLNTIKVRKTIVAGHSLGGYAGLAFAEKYPDSVLGLMLINSTAKGDSEKKINSRNQLSKLIKSNKSKALQLLVPGFFGIKKRNTHWQIKKYLKMAEQCSKRGISATIEGMKTRKEREIILKFSPFPYCYLAGLYDPIFDHKELKKESELGEKGYFALLENSSHMSPLEEKEAVYRLLKNFSSKLAIPQTAV